MSLRQELDRREFLKRCACGAIGGASLLSSQFKFHTAMGALLTDGATFSEYRALVCVFLSGGNDSWNTVLPTSAAQYSEYSQSRQNLAVAQASILPITTASPQGGATFGLHPSLAGLQQLYAQNRMAIVANVGTLIEPVTKAQYDVRPRVVRLPPQLFSHNDQTEHWMTANPLSAQRSGWAGRVADLISAIDPTALLNKNISLSGSNTLQIGATALPFNMSRNGVSTLNGLRTTNNREARRLQAFDALLGQTYTQPFMREFARIQTSAKANSATINTALQNLTPFATTFPTTSVGRDLQTVARMIAIRGTLNATRQIYFVRVGGYDNHGGQLQRHPQLLTELNDALLAFYNTTVELGLQDNVTTFSNSEFGRTLSSNGDGSDHGWGGHAMVIGGSVRGGDIYGTMPSLALGGPDDTRSGRLIPTIGVDQYSATLARWIGLSAAQLPTVFPNLANFGTPTLNFML